MDRVRTDQHARRRKRWLIVGAAVLAFAAIAVAIARLKPAAPTVERNLVWIDTVKRGPMLRQVCGIGSLVPEDITWIAARTQGRVDRIVLRPGAKVTPDDVILVLTNPDVRQAAADADSQLKAAEAEVVNLKSQLQSGLLAAESAAAAAKAKYEQSKLKAEVNKRLFKDGLVSELELRLSKVTAEQAQTRNEIEQKRFAFTRTSIAPQLAVKRAEVERLRAQAKLRPAPISPGLPIPRGSRRRCAWRKRKPRTFRLASRPPSTHARAWWQGGLAHRSFRTEWHGYSRGGLPGRAELAG